MVQANVPQDKKDSFIQELHQVTSDMQSGINVLEKMKLGDIQYFELTSNQ